MRVMPGLDSVPDPGSTYLSHCVESSFNLFSSRRVCGRTEETTEAAGGAAWKQRVADSSEEIQRGRALPHAAALHLEEGAAETLAGLLPTAAACRPSRWARTAPRPPQAGSALSGKHWPERS